MLEHRSYFSPSTSTSRFHVSHVPPSTRNIRACHRDETNVSPVRSIYFTCLFQSRLITSTATSCVNARVYVCVKVCVFSYVRRSPVHAQLPRDLHNTRVFTDSSMYTSVSAIESDSLQIRAMKTLPTKPINQFAIC